MLSHPERGSALIESVAIGSVVFLIIVSAVGSAIRVAITGTEAREAARAGAIHAARHDHPPIAEVVAQALLPGSTVVARREGDSVIVTVRAPVVLSHPGGTTIGHTAGRARMPIAPFRSARE